MGVPFLLMPGFHPGDREGILEQRPVHGDYSRDGGLAESGKSTGIENVAPMGESPIPSLKPSRR
jgi:hypothetical protein